MEMLKKFIAVTLILSMSACTSMKPIDKTAVNTNVEAGDNVKIVTKDDRQVEFMVVEVTDTSIVGQTESVPKDEIASIKKKKIDAGKTAVVGAYGYFLVSIIILAAKLVSALP